tara:strand:+ start:1832 stop:2023 length:192 start_codon:yes stop_codon:yes gene_type:complete
MQRGDLIRYRRILDHSTEEMSDWKLGVLINNEYSIAEIITSDGLTIKLWSSQVEKAGRKDAER